MRKNKIALLFLGLLSSLFVVFAFSSCGSSNPYVKAKGSHSYKQVKVRQASWSSTTSLQTTYRIKNKKHKSSSVKLK